METKKSEDKIQQEIVVWFRNTFCLAHHNPKLKIFAVPNADVSSDAHRIKMFSTGVEAGVADLIVLLPGAQIIFVEVKTEIGRLSPKQTKFSIDVDELGFCYYMVRSIEQFKNLPEIKKMLC